MVSVLYNKTLFSLFYFSFYAILPHWLGGKLMRHKIGAGGKHNPDLGCFNFTALMGTSS